MAEPNGTSQTALMPTATRVWVWRLIERQQRGSAERVCTAERYVGGRGDARSVPDSSHCVEPVGASLDGGSAPGNPVGRHALLPDLHRPVPRC